MKGKLLIEPGFEAGSLHCGECNRLDHTSQGGLHCAVFFEFLITLGGTIDEIMRGIKRCQQCLDAEVKDEK